MQMKAQMHNNQTPFLAIYVFLHKMIQFFLRFHMKYRSSGRTIYIAQKTALKNAYAAIRRSNSIFL